VAIKSIDEVIAEGRLRQVLDLKLIKALAHAMRGHIVAVLNERVASPNDVAKELGMDVAYVSYHFRVLRDDYGLIEQVSTSDRRGFTEHFYRGNFDAATLAILGFEALRAAERTNEVAKSGSAHEHEQGRSRASSP
jgi:DNA-binding transcriptional ArsR family regulator